MKKHTLKLYSIALLSFGFTAAYGQSSTNSAGVESTGSGGTASSSVGQAVYTTNTGTSGSVAQGVQQPFEISVVTGLEKAKPINLEIAAFPNPTTDVLNLSIGNYNKQNLSYQIYTSTGKLLQSLKVNGAKTTINMSTFASGNYIIKVTDNVTTVKHFKIIKK